MCTAVVIWTWIILTYIIFNSAMKEGIRGIYCVLNEPFVSAAVLSVELTLIKSAQICSLNAAWLNNYEPNSTNSPLDSWQVFNINIR